MKALVLRLDAPMISFGSVLVDQHGFTDYFPGISMLTGLLANALGWQHRDFTRLQRLQDRIDLAARWDVEPERIIDYHTVDLGSAKMCQPGWTTGGRIELRGKNDNAQKLTDAQKGTHIRYRHYLIDGLMTLVLGFMKEGDPDIEDLKNALKKPARPLFLGRKTCLPARPLLDPINPIMEGQDLLSILLMVPVWNREGSPRGTVAKVRTCWTPRGEGGYAGRDRLVYDLRDWHNQLPAGSRWRREGMIGGNKG